MLCQRKFAGDLLSASLTTCKYHCNELSNVGELAPGKLNALHDSDHLSRTLAFKSHSSSVRNAMKVIGATEQSLLLQQGNLTVVEKLIDSVELEPLDDIERRLALRERQIELLEWENLVEGRRIQLQCEAAEVPPSKRHSNGETSSKSCPYEMPRAVSAVSGIR
jgi:hypothetical protein